MEISLSGLTIHFEVYGSGPQLVVLPGWGMTVSSWQKVAGRLQGQFQVFLLDLPGFGGSELPPDTWGLAEYRDLVKQFIAELGIVQPIILGHSNGGKIACAVAADLPEVKALVLVAASGVDVRSLKVKLKILSFKTLSFIARKIFGAESPQILRLRERFGSTDYKNAGNMRSVMSRLVGQKLFSILPQIKTPALIIWGSKDETLDMQQSLIFRSLLRNSHIRVAWEVGHNVPGEAPEMISDYVQEFWEAAA